MKLKTITLLAAITQLLTVILNLYNYISTYADVLRVTKWPANARLLLIQPVYLIAHITLVVFLFTLFARQKSN